ncbi:MAG TPA: holo-ACP synthase [Halomonas sp.]|nr:holo-ACP synthase [Halomonas sp.]
MIVGIGTDVARIARFERAVARHGERFVERILGVDERLAFVERGRSPAFLAKRFAAKEAFVKALGTGLRNGLRWQDIQIASDALGRPRLVLSGRARELALAAGVTSSHVSLSDEADVALAFVLLEG